ncbi:thioester-forming surface-anchored protein [Helcococcus ovis]|uniref:thioester-forming surface-anchored protein n=1 Tax=Helcococcus ovis TaxID=72026 RepID=UPI0038B7F5E8
MKEKWKKLISSMVVIFLFMFYISTSFAMGNAEKSRFKASTSEYTWLGYSEDGMIKIKQQESISYDVYCFNKDRKQPPALEPNNRRGNYRHNHRGGITYKRIDGTSALFTTYATKARTQNQEELYNRILSIIYNGYPTNANNILDGLSDTEANDVTQAAIWYYTDREESHHFLGTTASREKKEAAYKKLISSNLEESVSKKRPENFKLNLFVTEQKDEEKKEYQNLLSVVYIPNNPSKKTDKKYIKVMKVWDGIKTGEKTPKVLFQLFKGDTKIGEAKEFDGAPIIFEIDKKENIKEYTVREVNEGKKIENGQTTKIDGNLYEVTYEGDAEKGFKVINKKNTESLPPQPKKVKVLVEKKWQDNEGKNINSPLKKIEVELCKDGVATGNKLELNKNNNWSGEFDKLPESAKLGGVNHKYTVKEVGEIDKAIKLDGKVFTVSYEGDMKNGFKIINKEKPPVPPVPPKPPVPPVQPKNPNTSDNFTNMTFISITIISALGLGYISLNKNKKTNR